MKKKRKNKAKRRKIVLAICIVLNIGILISILYLLKGAFLKDTETFPKDEDKVSGEVADESLDKPGEDSSADKDTELPGEVEDTEASEFKNDEEVSFVRDGIEITKIGKYTGLYVEDGTDEMVENQLMIMLHNTSDKDLQYTQISFSYGDAVALFSVTNLPAGEKAVLLEQNRMSFTGELVDDVTFSDVVFLEKMSLHEDVFRITALEGVLNVKNISDKDISGDIYVYYKNYAGGMYYGGITYRVKIEGGLKAGEIRQLMANHFDDDGSAVLMVTYAE